MCASGAAMQVLMYCWSYYTNTQIGSDQWSNLPEMRLRPTDVFIFS